MFNREITPVRTLMALKNKDTDQIDYHDVEISKDEFWSTVRKFSNTDLFKIDKKDKYKRYIAICYVNGVNLNHWLVLNGWAVAYQKYSKASINAEAIARSQEVGIWSGEFILPWKWRRGKRLR